MDICLKKCGEKDIIGGIMDIHFAWYAIDWIHYNTHTFEWSSGYIGITVRQCLSIRGFVFGLQLFLSFDILVILCLACECITMVRCVACIHDLSMTLTFHLNMKVIFSPWIWVWQNVFALWHRHTKFWHMGVSPWDMLCTFSTLVWLWPLTYMWVAGVS